MQIEEQLNKIVLRGNVGSVRISEIGGTRLAKIAVATNEAYRGKDGCFVIETTWHNVSAWEKEGMEFDKITKGCGIYIEGRMKQQRYTSASGETHTTYEVLANKVDVLG